MTARWTNDSMPSQKGKTIIVTGANSGIGLEAATELANKGATVIMACRSTDKAEKARQSVLGRVSGGELVVMQLDVSDFESIKAFNARFIEQYDRLDVLINNAGVMGAPEILRTKHGFESQIGTNHLGHFVLTAGLMPLLKKTPSARVVAVASVAHKQAKNFNPDDINFEQSEYKPFYGYTRSKLANLLFMRELNKRVKAAGLDIKAIACHPGYSATNITSGANPEGSKIKDFLAELGNKIMAMPAWKGALPTTYAATHPDLKGGEFIGPMGPLQFWGWPGVVQPSPDAQNDDFAQRLWATSEKLTGTEFQI